jgi:hypothetical protein
MIDLRRLFTIILLLWLGSLEVSAQSDPSDVPKRQRRKSPIESNIFLGDWWDYYNRAVRRFDGGDLQGAESDLREAIKFNDDENPRARTYGVHFQEYFPHAELGAILFESGRYWEAIPELIRSLKAVPLEQSRFYLHEARRQVALRSPIDKKLPTIRITDPPSGLITNKTRVRIRGVAEDDLFVDKITVGDDRPVIERASSRITFETEVKLPRETNHIPVTVYDLMGQSQTVLVSVIVDSQGPVFVQERLEFIQGDSAVILVGTAFDRNIVSEIHLNGSTIPTHGQSTESINATVPLSSGQESIKLVLIDGFGNQTEAEIPLRQRVGKASGDTWSIRTAAIDVNSHILAGLNFPGPRIQILEPLHAQHIFSENVWVSGVVQDSSGITSIRVDDIPVDLPEGRKNRCYFGLSAGPLAPGTNTVRIQATNLRGVEAIHEVVILSKPLRSLALQFRLALALQQFQPIPTDSSDILTEEIFGELLSNLSELDRFHLIDPGKRSTILREREIAASPAADNRMRGPDASLVPSDVNLSGRIFIRPTTLKVFLDVTETRTGSTEVLRGFEVTRSENAIENLAHDFAIRLLQRYPLAEGSIIQSVTKSISTLSSLDGVRQGMEVIVFKDPKTNPVPVGPLKLLRVEPTFSLLETLTNELPLLEPGDSVITR